VALTFSSHAYETAECIALHNDNHLVSIIVAIDLFSLATLPCPRIGHCGLRSYVISINGRDICLHSKSFLYSLTSLACKLYRSQGG
jgi:hypothetical protein